MTPTDDNLPDEWFREFTENPGSENAYGLSLPNVLQGSSPVPSMSITHLILMTKPTYNLMQGTSTSDEISESAAFDRWFLELTEMILSFEVDMPTTAASDLSSESVAFERWFREFTETPIRENAFEYTSVAGPSGSRIERSIDREYEVAGVLLDKLANLFDTPLPPVPGSVTSQQATGVYEWDPSFGLAGGPMFNPFSIDWLVATTTENQDVLCPWLAEPFPILLVPSQAPLYCKAFAMLLPLDLFPMIVASQEAAYVMP
ncbi:hypothetical protein AcV7_010205 [Taiwanofungus camphoratus]|nr:hypothetical protein AcV7_010205 [Antrodia cinnamomea]